MLQKGFCFFYRFRRLFLYVNNNNNKIAKKKKKILKIIKTYLFQNIPNYISIAPFKSFVQESCSTMLTKKKESCSTILTPPNNHTQFFMKR